MGHLVEKYTNDYFLGGIDQISGQEYGVLGHKEFKDNRVHEHHAREFEFTRAFTGKMQGKDILEIGFGRGDHIPFFLGEEINSYYGIDFSINSVHIAEEKYKDPKIRIELAEAANLDESRLCDIIVMYDLIEHVPVYEMEIVWRKIMKMLCVGGFVVISTPIFTNPNIADHSDKIYSVMGMHCHKQTLGTIIRTCLKHGFIIAKNDERYLGLVRCNDLLSFSECEKGKYVSNYNKLLSEFGLKGSEYILTEEKSKLLVEGPGRILIGCVAENNPKYLEQALRLVKSIRWFGGKIAGSNVMVCIVDEADPEYVKEFNKWGAFVRIVPRFTFFHRHSNKLRLFDLPEIPFYDTVIMLDCDTIIVQDPWNFLDGSNMQAKMADAATVLHNVFSDLFSHYGLALPAQVYKCTFSSQRTIWYCNTGVLVFPQSVIKKIVPVWRKYTEDLAANINLLKECSNFCEQASLSLAFYDCQVSFKELPVSMNFPVHLTEPPSNDMIRCDPVILHYHSLVDESGFLKGSPYPNAQKRIAEFNAKLSESRQYDFNNKLFWNLRYSEYPELGSGLGSRSLSLIYKKQIVKQIYNKTKPDSILDVGCGDQYVTEELPDDGYLGVDISDIIIERNKNKYPNRKYVKCNFLENNFKKRDLVICLDVLIHMGEKSVYKEFIRHIVSCTGKFAIVSGYEKAPSIISDITFYYEPLSKTLKDLGIVNIKEIGKYRDTSIILFSIDIMDELDNHQNSMVEPNFIVGCMRSGTTILAEILGRHNNIVHCPFELKYIWSNVGGVPMASPRTGDNLCPYLGAEDVKSGQAEGILQAFYQEWEKNRNDKSADSRFLSKNPHLCNKLFFVDKLFPKAKYIWIYRDMIQVVASLKKLFHYGYNKYNIWHYWPIKNDKELYRCWNCYWGVEMPEDVIPARCFPGGDVYYLAEYWLENNMAVKKFFATKNHVNAIDIQEEDLINNMGKVTAECFAFMEVPLEEYKEEDFNLDLKRNDLWKSILDKEEIQSLGKFIEKYEIEINSILPHKAKLYKEILY